MVDEGVWLLVAIVVDMLWLDEEDGGVMLVVVEEEEGVVM